MVGYFVMAADGDSSSRDLLVLATIFLVSQAFVAAKASRDHKMASTIAGTRATGDFQLFVPTRSYLFQVAGFFLLSLIGAIYALARIRVQREWYGFAGLGLLWVLVAALCVQKSMRDRRDADNYSAMPLEKHDEQLPHLIEMCTGTPEYRALVWSTFPVALLLTLGWTWLGFPGSQLPVERKGFLSIALIFNAVSCFHVAKLVRDRANPAKNKELAQQFAFQGMVVSSFVLSLSVELVALMVMPLEAQQRFFLCAGQLMTANTALNLAKLVRDGLEVRALQQSPASAPE
jgi:hypothetical protein